MNTKIKTIFKMLNVMPYEKFKLQYGKTEKDCREDLFCINENLEIINLGTHSSCGFNIGDILTDDMKIVKLPQGQYKFEDTKWEIISVILMNDIFVPLLNRKYNAEWYNPEIDAIVGVYDKYDPIKDAGTYSQCEFYLKDYGVNWVDCTPVWEANNE